MTGRIKAEMAKAAEAMLPALDHGTAPSLPGAAPIAAAGVKCRGEGVLLER